jgi:CRP/FNR family transcriptional regulator, cyclic AMP receptor protein
MRIRRAAPAGSEQKRTSKEIAFLIQSSRCGPRRERSPMTQPKPDWNNYDPEVRAFLANAGSGRKVVGFHKKQTIFTQGDAAGAVFYIQAGRVRHTVVSRFGKEATLDTLSAGEFLGYCGLAGQPLRAGTATAITECKLLQIDNEAMLLELNRRRALTELFVEYLLACNIRNEERLVEQLFDSSAIRVARALLLLADFGKDGKPAPVISRVSHETLADMTGTTPLNVRFSMKGFRKSGFLAYGRKGLEIRSSLLNVVLHELPRPSPPSKTPSEQ